MFDRMDIFQETGLSVLTWVRRKRKTVAYQLMKGNYPTEYFTTVCPVHVVQKRLLTVLEHQKMPFGQSGRDAWK